MTRNFTQEDVEREEREGRALLKEAGLLDEISGAEAALEDLMDDEVCRDLAGQRARESATKTGDMIGDVLDRYQTIAIEFRCVIEPNMELVLSREAIASKAKKERREDGKEISHGRVSWQALWTHFAMGPLASSIG